MIYILGDKNRKINDLLVKSANEIASSLNKKVRLIFIDSEIKDYEKNYAVDEIVLLKNKDFNIYDYEKYTRAFLSIIDENVDLILFSSSDINREIASILSSRLNKTLLSNSTDIKVENNEIVGIRPSLDGSSFSKFKLEGDKPYLITVKSATISDKIEKKEISDIDIIEIKDEKNTLEILEINEIKEKSVNIKDAEIIFSGGRGLLNDDSFMDLRTLAKKFNAEVAGSRPTVDLKWISAKEQVGQTGSFVKPKVYLAFGISGAIQHIAGMGQSQNIIAINNNKNSPIFKYANYGIVADANSIIRNMLNILEKENANR